VQDDGGCETEDRRPQGHPNPCTCEMISVWAADDDAKEPCTTPVDRVCKSRAESDNSPEDHHGNSGADATRQENGAHVAASHTEDQHVGESEGNAETAIHRQHDSLTLGAEYGLADEMEDCSLRGKGQYGGLQNVLERRDGTAWRVNGSAPPR